MVNRADILRTFRRQVCDEIELVEVDPDRLLVSTPFTFDDGDELVIYLMRRSGSWYLSDQAHTFMHLSYKMDERDWKRGQRAKVIERALSMFRIENRNGELVRHIDAGYGPALFDFIQGLLKITDIDLLSRDRVRSTFVEDFQDFVRQTVPQNRRTFNWIDTEHDPDGMYPVDLYVQGRDRPLFVYALNTDNRVRDATISLLKFEQWRVPHESAGVFEDAGEISEKHLKKFMDAAGKLFSNLSGNRERLAQFFENRLN